MTGVLESGPSDTRPAVPSAVPPAAVPPPDRWRADDVVLAILGAALVVAVWPVVDALGGPAPVRLPVLIAHVAGMLAGYGVVVLVGLMSRTPALERGIGADRLARWHSTGGRTVVVLVLVHAWAATLAWA